MTTPLAKPSTIVEPFAINGQKNTIPTTQGATPGQASLDLGFPPETMTAVALGGTPPSGKDFNGILNWITAHLAWMNAGGAYTFDPTLSTFIGGYPIGMVLQSNNGRASYVNIVAGNTTDFNTTPSAIGVSWLPYGGDAVSSAGIASISTVGGTTTLAGDQYVKNVIVITGALTSNATLVFPTITRTWTVINKTTGAFSVTCRTAAGSGLSPSPNATESVACDGTNIVFTQADTPTQALGNNSTLIANTAFVTNAIAAALVNTALTGTPTAPTPAASDNTTKIATTAFTVTAITNAIAAALVNTALTGTPTAPTPAASDNTTKIATMAALQTVVSNASINVVQQYKSANFTAGTTGEYWVDTTSSAITMTLPDPPVGQNLIKVVDIGGNWYNLPLTVNAGTKTILGSASNLVCDVSGEEFKLWYNGSDWRLE